VAFEERMRRGSEETGPLISDRLRQPQHILEPVGGRAAIPGLQARRADAREAQCGDMCVLCAHDRLTPAGVLVARGLTGTTVRPAWGRTGGGGGRPTSPKGRRIRATEKTSRSRARVMPT